MTHPVKLTVRVNIDSRCPGLRSVAHEHETTVNIPEHAVSGVSIGMVERQLDDLMSGAKARAETAMYEHVNPIPAEPVVHRIVKQPATPEHRPVKFTDPFGRGTRWICPICRDDEEGMPQVWPCDVERARTQ